MKLLQALREKIYEEQGKLCDLFAKAVGFNSRYDSTTVITRESAKHAHKFLTQNRTILIDSFPKEHIKKLIGIEKIDAQTDLGDILTIFKQLLRSQKARLISRKNYAWNVEQRRQSYSLEYRIICIPQPKTPKTVIPTSSTPQTLKTSISNTHTPDTNTIDTNVSTIKTLLPSTVVMSAKRKLSPTPAPIEQPPDKKTKPSTPQKEQSSPSNTNMSDVKVLDTSPIPTNSPSPTTLDQTNPPVSPKTLSPTPGVGLAVS